MGIFVRKNETALALRYQLISSVCCEILDRSARLKIILLNSADLLFLTEAEVVSDLQFDKKQNYIRDWSRLRELRSEVLASELRLDASVWKLTIFLGDQAPEFFGAEGFFVSKVDRAISDHSDAHNPDTSEAVQVLSVNYLSEEERFPFGSLFDEKEIEKFFNAVRWAVESIARKLKI